MSVGPQPLGDPWRLVWTHSLPPLAIQIRLMNSLSCGQTPCSTECWPAGHPICFFFGGKVCLPQVGGSASKVTMARSGVVPRDRRDSPVVRGELKSQER